ncbi:unnamed protein product [Cuscuta europaea]|uniref:RNase H type-1 domain-containing protein n=1 Tax=Cuscuta europaea TaxID=41803 RepID=A0A9P0Z282_CUSEU|nr:unnamed protein product [Cuscuta europaea]
MSWWLQAGTKSIVDCFKHNLQGIIAWHIWKLYCNLVWGELNKAPSIEFSIHQIRLFSKAWSSNLNSVGAISLTGVLEEEHLIPKSFRFPKPKIKTVKWKLPGTDLKLNVDASSSSDGSVGGAVMRTRSGDLIFALHFPIRSRSPLDAEMVAFHFLIRWAIEHGFTGFEAETDSLGVINFVCGGCMEKAQR